MTVTLNIDGEATEIATTTMNISSAGCLVKLDRELDVGTLVHVALLDDTGALIDMDGVVARQVPGMSGEIEGTGIHFPDPGLSWFELCKRKGALTMTAYQRAARRLRILVVGDEARIRGALALYVTSGFDVQFAGTLEQAHEAMTGGKLDAIIAERDLGDPAWVPILSSAMTRQPAARRLVRSVKGRACDEDAVVTLVDRVVDPDGGVESLIDAITAQRL